MQLMCLKVRLALLSFVLSFFRYCSQQNLIIIYHETFSNNNFSKNWTWSLRISSSESQQPLNNICKIYYFFLLLQKVKSNYLMLNDFESLGSQTKQIELFKILYLSVSNQWVWPYYLKFDEKKTQFWKKSCTTNIK